MKSAPSKKTVSNPSSGAPEAFFLLSLFGLLAVEMAVGFVAQGQQGLVWTLAAVFLALNLFFVRRSFYGMRIEG